MTIGHLTRNIMESKRKEGRQAGRKKRKKVCQRLSVEKRTREIEKKREVE
jgi:hypothetical protein